MSTRQPNERMAQLGHSGASGHQPRLRCAAPTRPTAPAGAPQVVEHHCVLVGVHAVPEAVVPEGAQLPGGGQAAQRLALEHARRVQVVEEGGSKQKNPPLTQWSSRGFSSNASTRSSSVQLGDAELERGRTTVTVADRRVRGGTHSASRSMSATPSA